jgi:plastocyanin
MRGRGLTAAAAVAVIAALGVATVAWAGASHRQVVMFDACDGPSFNEATQMEVCDRNGGVTFQRFIGQLEATGNAPAWHFSPGKLKLDAGGSITAVNKGGELHTFTEVADFGQGGCIPDLNTILGLPMAPNCDQIGPTGALPGGSVTTGPLTAGTHLFLCLIHPWMTTTVEVR